MVAYCSSVSEIRHIFEGFLTIFMLDFFYYFAMISHGHTVNFFGSNFLINPLLGPNTISRRPQ